MTLAEKQEIWTDPFSSFPDDNFMSISCNSVARMCAILAALTSITGCQSLYGQDQQVTLNDCLTAHGEKFDVYFTIESTVVDSPYEAYGYSNKLAAQIEESFKEAKQKIRLKRLLLYLKSSSVNLANGERNSVENAIEDLKKLFPSLEITQNKHKPQIYHIKDRSLPAKTILDQEFDKFNFHGPMHDLYEVLNISLDWELEIEAGRSTQEVGQAHYSSTTSITTPIDIKTLSSLTVRDILSIGFSLDGYKRVLWMANLDDEIEKIHIKPCGPLPVFNKAKRGQEDTLVRP